MKTRDVKAFEALKWVKEAWKIFVANPAAWLSIVGAWLGITILLMATPIIGGVALALLTPIFAGGMILACRDQLAGTGFTTSHLFSAFKESGRTLMAVGSLTFLCEMAIVMSMFGLGVPTPPKMESMEAIAAYAAQLKGHQGLLLLAFVSLIIVKALLWFTVPLLTLHKMPFTHALRWSLFAGFSNIGAGLVFIALLALSYIPVLLTFGLALIVAFPLFFICSYTSYVSVFDVSDNNTPKDDEPNNAEPPGST
jgi:hypothetical protein